MIEIDLHGFRHEDVPRIVERYINDFWGSGESFDIITGHSPKMKKIVIDILMKYNLQYNIGDYIGTNSGYIRTILN